MEWQEVANIINQNRDKEFVQRILRPKDYPEIDLGLGGPSTHLMGYSSGDGKFFVHPQLFYEGGELVDYGDEAPRHARETGNFIEFDSEEDAHAFSQDYKKMWD